MAYIIDIDGTSEGRWMGHNLTEIGCVWKDTSAAQVYARAKDEIIPRDYSCPAAKRERDSP